MNLQEAIIKIFSANVLGTVIGFVAIAYFAREIPPSELGIYFLFLAAVGIVGIFSDLGTSLAIEKRISEGSDTASAFASGILIKLFPIAIIGIGIIVLRNPLNNYIGEEVAIYLLVAIVLQEYGHLMLAVLRAELRVGETAIIKITQRSVWAVGGVIFVNLGFGALGVIYSTLIGLLLTLVWGGYKVSTPIGEPSGAQIVAIYDYAKYAILSSVEAKFLNWMDVVIIGFFLSQFFVSIYEISWQISVATVMIGSAISATIFPQISAWDASGATHKIERLLPKAILPSIVIVTPAIFGSVLFGREILGLIFGPDYAIAYAALVILLVGMIAKAVRSVVGRSLFGIGRADLLHRAALLDLIINLILNVVLIWQYGIIGAAIATSMTYLVGTIQRWWYLSNEVTVILPLRKSGYCLVASFGMTAILFILNMNIVVDSIASLLTMVIAGAIIYFTILLLIPPMREDIYETLIIPYS